MNYRVAGILLFAVLIIAVKAASACSVTITNPSNAIVDVGQYESFTATQASCVSPFTYNIIVVNYGATTITRNDLLTGQTANSVTYTFQTISADISNGPEKANVVLTDSGTNTVTSAYSSLFSIYSTLSTPTIYPSNPTIDSGQLVTFSSTWPGGTPDYTAKLYSSSTSTCNSGSTLVQTQSSLTLKSVSFTVVSPTSTTYYCIFVTDSASTPVTVNSINSEVTVNPALSIPTISPSDLSIDNGQSITFTSTWSGGTPTYGASLYSSATPACNQQSTLVQQVTGLSTTSVTFSPVTPNLNTYYCIFTTDNTVNSYSISSAITSGLNYPNGVAFSPSGTYAYVVNQESNNVVIINTATNTVTGSIAFGFNSPTGVAFSPSGTYAYVVNLGSTNVVIINTATNTVTSSVTNSIPYVFNTPEYVSFSPSGTYAYVTDYYADNVAIINTATNSVINSITNGIAWPTGVAFSPSGTYAYVVNFGSIPSNVAIINTATNSVTGSITSSLINDPKGVAFSPSGTYAYVANPGTYNVSIINTVTNTVTGFITSGLYFPSGVAFSPSGTYAYATNFGNNNVMILNPGVSTTNSINSEITVSPTLSTPSISPTNPTMDSGQSVTFSSTWSGGTPTYGASLYYSTTSTCNQQSILVQQIIGLSTTSVTFSPVTPNPNTYYCIFTTDNAVNSYSVSSAIPSGFNEPDGVSFSHHGTHAYVTNYGSNNVVIINTATSSVTNSITSGFDGPTEISISPSDTYAYVVNHISNNVVVINTATNTVTNSITSGFNEPDGVSFSHHGTHAYVTNYGSNNVVIINTTTNSVINSITSGFNGPMEISISPSGTYAYVTNQGANNVVIINTTTNSVINSITSGFNAPAGVSISPSGTYAYVANPSANNVAIINTATNSVIGSITSGFNDPDEVSFSPSGNDTYVTNYNSNNVVIISTGGAHLTASINSEISMNNALIVGAITPSSPTINSGQSITLNANVVGGTPPYTYNWYAIAGTVAPTCTAANQITGQNSNTLQASPTATSTYAYQAVDSATTNAIACSSGDTVNVNAGTSVSNPYAGGSTGFFGNTAAVTSATSSTTTTTAPTTSAKIIIPVITSSGAITHVCNDIHGYYVHYPLLNSTFYLRPSASLCFNVTASNATSAYISSNSEIIRAINYSFSNSSIMSNLTINYPCSTAPSVLLPVILRNGTWEGITPFTVNVSACTVTFAAPAGLAVALLNTSKSNSTTNTTTNATTTLITTAVQTTLPAAAIQGNNSSSWETVAIAVAVIMAIAILVYLRIRANRKW